MTSVDVDEPNFYFEVHNGNFELNRLTSLARKYNELLFEKFPETGVPQLLEDVCQVPLRHIQTNMQNSGASPFVYQSSPEWDRAFEEAMNARRWLMVNRLPEVTSMQAALDVVQIDLIHGLTSPWLESGVKSVQIDFHRAGLIRVFGMGTQPVDIKAGRKNLDDGSFVRQVVTLAMGMPIILGGFR